MDRKTPEEVQEKLNMLKRLEGDMTDKLSELNKLPAHERVDLVNDVDVIHAAVRALKWALGQKASVLHPALRDKLGLPYDGG